MTPNPNGPFMVQIARNLTDCRDGFLKGKNILLRDRDKNYCEQFDCILKDAGIEPKPLMTIALNQQEYCNSKQAINAATLISHNPMTATANHLMPQLVSLTVGNS